MPRNTMLFLVSLFVILISACIEKEKKGVDTVFMNGGIYVSDKSHNWSEAIGIDDGVIVIVGSNGEVRELIGNKTGVL